MDNIDDRYKEIDKIKSWLDLINEVREEGNEKKVNAFEFWDYPEGKELQLTVKVRDPDLVNVMLSSEWSDEGYMPGMDVVNIRFADLERKDCIIQWLEQKLEELRDE